MTVLAIDIERPSILGDVGGELTLDDVLSDAWEGLALEREVTCPVCRGTLVPRHEPLPTGGRCRDCGTTLT